MPVYLLYISNLFQFNLSHNIDKFRFDRLLIIISGFFMYNIYSWFLHEAVGMVGYMFCFVECYTIYVSYGYFSATRLGLFHDFSASTHQRVCTQ